MLRLGLAGLLIIAGSYAAHAQGYSYHQGYTTQSGTYVQPHNQTMPDNTTANNWSTQGNTNPFTGQPGTRNPDQSYGGQAQPGYGRR